VWLAIRPGEGGALALASVFSFTVRPDAIAFIAPIWAILLVLGEKRRGFVMLLAMLAVYVVCKWIYFGYPLPNTYYVKHAELLRGLDYVQGYLATLVPLWLFLAYAAGRVGLAKLLGDRTFLLLLLPSLMLCMGYVNLPPTVGTAYRLLIPTLPALCLACLRAHTLARFRSPAACLLALLAVTVVADVRIGRMYGPMREYFGQLNGMHVEAGHRLKQVSSLRPPPLLATRDIGAVSYFSQLPVLDLIGLSDEVVAHQGLTPEYVSERNPDVIMLQSVSEVPSLSALLEQYSHVAEWPYRDNGYDFFVRRDSPHYSELVALLRPQKVS
jgi:arabinofuranosyltransferase